MVKRVDSLTDEQKAMMPEWRDRWIAKGLRTGEADWDRFERGIRVAYAKAGFPFPETIVRVRSPLVGAFAASIADSVIQGDAVDDAVHNAVRVPVDDAVVVAVHNAVRVPVHNAVGVPVDDAVVVAVHNAVRVPVRDAVVVAVHNAVRVPVRDAVGAVVGDAVDDAVHNAVYNPVGGAVGNAVRDAVYNPVYNPVDDAVDGAVHAAVDDAVDGAVDNAVGAAVDDAVGAAVHAAVDDAVRVAVHNAVQPNLKWHEWIGGQFWVGGWWGSPAFVSFFTDVCGLELPPDIQERADAYRDICESVNYVWCNSKFVMVCERPAAIRRDQQGRLSSDQKMAIEYPDGWGLYALDGVVLPEELWKRIVSKAMTFEEIMRIENADHQAVALAYNPEAIIANGAKLIDGPTAKGNELYLLENSDLNGLTGYPQMYYVRMKCPTGRTFIEDVEPEFAGANRSADACQAFNGSLTPEMYRMLRREA